MVSKSDQGEWQGFRIKEYEQRHEEGDWGLSAAVSTEAGRDAAEQIAQDTFRKEEI